MVVCDTLEIFGALHLPGGSKSIKKYVNVHVEVKNHLERFSKLFSYALPNEIKETLNDFLNQKTYSTFYPQNWNWMKFWKYCKSNNW